MITLNNNNYEFNFSFRAMKGLEQKTGKKLSVLLTEMQDTKGVDFEMISDIAYFGMQFTKNPKTQDEIEELLDNGTSKDIEEIVKGFMSSVERYLEVDPNLKSQTS